MEDSHQRQIAELERDVADAKRQHTKTGMLVSSHFFIEHLVLSSSLEYLEVKFKVAFFHCL